MMPKRDAKSGNFAFTHLQKYSLLIGLLCLVALFLYFISPFFAVLIVAGVIAIDLHPFNVWLTSKIKYRSLASMLTTLLVLIVGVTPLVLFVTFISTEALSAAKNFLTAVDFSNIDVASFLPASFVKTEIGSSVAERLNSLTFSFSGDELVNILNDSLSSITSLGGELVNQTTLLFKRVTTGMLYMVIFVLCLFYFLYDGKRFSTRVKDLLPIPIRYKDPLFLKLNDLSKGIIYGIFGAAIVQGVFGGLGFYIAGINNAAFWGTMMAIFSPVPYIGPALVWGPMMLYLFVTGQFLTGLFVMIWGALVVGSVDNIVKPYLIGKSAEINSLLVLLTLIGGVLIFGVKALVFAPFLLTLMLSLLHIYEMEYHDVLKK